MATQDPSPPSSLEGNKPGFPKKILANKLEDKHLCNCCQNILRRPFQAQCGHRFCSYCFNRTVSSGPQKCSACIKEDIFEDPTSILTLGCAFPDNAARREVEALPAVCLNEGCSWKGSIKEYEALHEGKCEFMIIACPSCGEAIRFNEQERHNERECPERTLNCKYCKEPFHFKNIKAHDEICPKYPMICEGCAKKKIPREKYVDHIKFCSKFRAPCRFHVVGCNTSVEKEKVLDHERACSYEHLNLLLHYIMGIKVNLEGIQPQSLEHASLKIHELHQSVRELEAKMGHLSAAPPVQGAAAAAAPPVALATSFTPLPSSATAALELQLHSEKAKVAELSRRCQELELKVGTFENIVCVLNREVERSSTTLEAYNRQHRLDQEKIETLGNKVRQLERTAGLKDLTIAEMEGKLRELLAATYDGVFVWRISDFTKKSLLHQQVRLQDVPAHLPERRRHGARHTPVPVLRGDARAERRPAQVALQPEGDPDAAGPEQPGAHHRRLPARRHLLLLPAARQRDEHRQRLPALLPAVQAGLQELLHPGRHHLHQGHRGPDRALVQKALRRLCVVAALCRLRGGRSASAGPSCPGTGDALCCCCPGFVAAELSGACSIL
nr:PREDICTED: TNF receptor-associated factor 2-like isoform X1 [Lepisosteus oculatus]